MLDAVLLTLALALQTADGAYTCHRLRQGATELNAVLGQSCPAVVLAKSAALGLIPLVRPGTPRRVYLGVLAGGGGVALGFSIHWSH